jgi:hypothetical protein
MECANASVSRWGSSGWSRGSTWAHISKLQGLEIMLHMTCLVRKPLTGHASSCMFHSPFNCLIYHMVWAVYIFCRFNNSYHILDAHRFPWCHLLLLTSLCKVLEWQTCERTGSSAAQMKRRGLELKRHSFCWIFGAFATRRSESALISFLICLSVRIKHREMVNGFLLNLLLEMLTKFRRTIQILVKGGRRQRPVQMNMYALLEHKGWDKVTPVFN